MCEVWLAAVVVVGGEAGVPRVRKSVRLVCVCARVHGLSAPSWKCCVGTPGKLCAAYLLACITAPLW